MSLLVVQSKMWDVRELSNTANSQMQPYYRSRQAGVVEQSEEEEQSGAGEREMRVEWREAGPLNG